MFIENRINNHNQPHRGGMSSPGFDEPNNVLRIVSHDVKNYLVSSRDPTPACRRLSLTCTYNFTAVH